MKKWFRFFGLSFFSHNISKEGAKRGYGNLILSFFFAMIFIWIAFIGGEMLPFGSHYKNSPDFAETVHSVFANADLHKRVNAEIQNGSLMVKNGDGEYAREIFVNTFESVTDRQNYSVNGYNIVVDTRPADTLAEIEAYFVSNDGKNTVISYEDYLTLSEVARLNFDFKIKYTGRALSLNDETVAGYVTYLESLNEESKREVAGLKGELSEKTITKDEYNRKVYEIYFVNYYPDIAEYESTSKLPLLRNYYYHQYIIKGSEKYLFVFDDYLTGSFETNGGIKVVFHGFFSDIENGLIVNESASQSDAEASVDGFIKSAFKATEILALYSHTMNTFSLVPVVAVMIMVAALLTYSILRLGGVESISSLSGMFKIVGSYVWFSGVSASAVSLVMAFFVGRNLIGVLPLLLFFVTLAVRSLVFAVKEKITYTKQSEQQPIQTEV